MTAQYPPTVGIDTNPARLIVCALMWSTPEQVRSALELVTADDFTTPHRDIIYTIAQLASHDVTGAEAVMSELLRRGDFHGAVRREMEIAPLAGGVPEGIRDYATSYLAQRFRDCTAAYGNAITAASETSPEGELWGSIVDGGRELRRLSDRLAQLRGGAL